MARVTAFIEDREGGRYFVQVESSFPNQRIGKDFTIGYEAAFDRAKELCREFGVDDAQSLPTMRPALQADIDRAQAAQKAAGDVSIDDLVPDGDGFIKAVNPQVWHDLTAAATEWRDGSLDALNAGVVVPLADDGAAIPPVKRGPGRPRKEA